MARYKYQNDALVTVGKMIDKRREEIAQEMAAIEKEREALATAEITHRYETWDLTNQEQSNAP